MRRSWWFFCVLAAACEAPPAFPGADKRQNTASGRIEGSAIVNSTARGKLVLFLYDAARPPPPLGTGRPLTFTVVAKDAVFAGAREGDAGPFTAPFAFSLVAPGSYLIRGFVDADDDFVPWYGVTADTTQGDVGGAAIDPVSRAPRIVEVTVDSAGNPVAAVDVPVTFSDTARLPLDRPSFSVAGGAEQVTLTAPTVLELESLVITDGAIGQAAPGFLLRFVDDDGDGVADDANRDGRPDLWPRVVVRKLAADPLFDENDLDRNGVIDAEGIDNVLAMSGAKDGSPDAVVLAAGFDPTEYASQLVDGTTGRVKATPTLVSHLKLAVQPRAFDVATGVPLQLALVPAGRYAITVIQQTGQTWRVPNELSPETSAARGLPAVTSQRFVIEVP